MSDIELRNKFDAAYEFVAVNDVDSELETAANYPKHVYRRVDWVILPLLCGIYSGFSPRPYS